MTFLFYCVIVGHRNMKIPKKETKYLQDQLVAS
jgi:hypothetical protein